MERIQQIEGLIRLIEASADPQTATRVRELVEGILEFHGAGLEKILEIVGQSGSSADPTIQALARDELVGSLLLLYGLHPETFETRVRRAVNSIPHVQVIAVVDGAVHLKTSSVAVSREAVEQIVYGAAPETASIVIEGPQAATSSFVPVEALLRA